MTVAGAIDAHHGSDINAIQSLERIRDSDVKWLAPSHGPIFRNEPDLLNKTIERLQSYLQIFDFGVGRTLAAGPMGRGSRRGKTT